MNLFRRKSVTELQAEAESDHSLKRALGAVNLTALGIGAIIGTGIFVLIRDQLPRQCRARLDSRRRERA